MSWNGPTRIIIGSVAGGRALLGAAMRRALPFLMPLLVATLMAYGVSRYAFVGDDAYISFRYAKNLVDGLGLVWNPGQAVEGYTNFLWVLILAFGMSVGLPPEPLSMGLGIASGIAVLLLTVALGTENRSWREPLVWFAPLWLASSRTFTAWCTGGLETMLFALLVLAAFWAFLRERGRVPSQWWSSGLLLALATLTRPEGALFTLAVGLCFLADVVLGQRRLRDLVAWATLWWAVEACHLAFRYATYGTLLPNTFYAKVNGFWPEQGREFLLLFHDDYKVLFWGWLALIPPLWLRRPRDVLFLLGIVLYVAYVWVIGGDRFEFRFLVCVLPLFVMLCADGLGVLLQRLPAPWRLSATVAVLLMLSAGTVAGSRRTENSMRHHVAGIFNMRAYANRRAREGQQLAEWIASGLLKEDLRICTGGAGALPYYSGVWTLDYFGLNDAVVAAEEIERHTRIGHENQADPEYILARKVDVVELAGISGRLVYRKSDGPRKAMELAHVRANTLNRMAHSKAFEARCIVRDAHYLVYVSPLPDKKHKRLMKGFAPCPAEW